MSQFLQTREETEAWLQKMNIKRFSIRDDLTVDVEAGVDLCAMGIRVLPVRFGVVQGHFDCTKNKLTSLAGAPISVGSYFKCGDNLLATLKGSPESVGGHFTCYRNQLSSLVGGPRSVGAFFSCQENPFLTSLTGAPISVGGDFYCDTTKIESLEGVPSKIPGDLWCTHIPLKSLAGVPQTCRQIYCDFTGNDLHRVLLDLFRSGAEFSAGNLAREIAAAKAEVLADKMHDAIRSKEGAAIPRRKAGERV